MKKRLTFSKKLFTLPLVIFLLVYCCFLQVSASSSEQLDALQEILNGYRTIESDFIEETNTSVSHGKIFVKKPGMIKIEYEAPEKIFIYINKDIITYYNHELDEVSKVKQNPQFLAYLSKDRIDLRKDFKSAKCETNGNEDILTLKLKNDDINSSLHEQSKNTTNQEITVKLVFLKHSLHKVLIYSNGEVKTILHFNNFKRNIDIKSESFVFRNKQLFDVE